MSRIRVVTADDVNPDLTVTTIDKYGSRPDEYDNRYIQSVSQARNLGAYILAWSKDVHSNVQLRVRFAPDVEFLDPYRIRSAYGNFSAESELWLVVGIRHSIDKVNESYVATTTLELVNVSDNPSAEPSAS
jgi:hypothetical protein